MSAGGLTAASGFLQGFAQSYNAVHQRSLQIQLDQRHQLGQTLATIYADPNTRPEAKTDAVQRLLKLYSTPINKKIDKGIADISTLGQAQMQQALQSGAQANAQPNIVPPGPTTATFAPGPPLPTPEVPAGAPIGTSQPTPPPGAVPNTITVGQGPQQSLPIPPPPDISKPGGGYSVFYTPEEKATIAAHASALQAEEQIAAQIRARDAYLQAHPDADVTELSMALGHTMPMWAMRIQTLAKGVMGSDLLKNDPSVRTLSGQAIDPNTRYDLGSQGGQKFAMPTGVTTESALAGKVASEARSRYYDARVGMIPYQTAKIVQDMQLNPEKVEIARANSAARWFGPTPASRQSAQFAADVEDKIDDTMPLISKLAASGKLSAFQGRWETFLTSKVRSGDPDVANLQAQFDIIGKALMRTHGFRNLEGAKEFIAQNLNAATNAEQLIGSLEGLRTSMRSYEQMGDIQDPALRDQIWKALTGGKQVKQPSARGGRGNKTIPAPPNASTTTPPPGAVPNDAASFLHKHSAGATANP